MIIRRHSIVAVLFYMIVLLILSSCSQSNIKEYFQSHDMSYPLDMSGVVAGNCKFINIKQEEISTEESQRYVEDGILFIRSYFQGRDIRELMKGIEALIISKPVLYRNESGEVGLMVSLTGYGQSDPSGRTLLPVEWIGGGKQFWRVVNFRYFFRNEDYRWQYGGQVYEDGE